MAFGNDFLPFMRHLIEDDDVDEVVNTLRSDWLTTGPKTNIFEEKFKLYVGSDFAVALNSCTAGLHLALVVAGIEKGDEVITTPLTFTATSEAIIRQGAKPIFVDVHTDTYNIDEEQILEKITPRTKAILPMHFGGHPCELKAIQEIADDYGLVVIEDAAHALSAEYEGKKIGSISDITAFSFHPTKNITTGEGGMITTNNEEYAKRIKRLSLHGISKDTYQRYNLGSWYYEVLEAGFKYNITDIQSSLGITQLNKIERFWGFREKYFDQYNAAFQDIPEIAVPTVKNNVRHSYHLYPILLRAELLNIDRGEFIKRMNDEKIGTSVHYIPLHLHPYYKTTFGYEKGDYPNAEYVGDREVSLPIYPKLTTENVQYVIDTVTRLIDECRI